MSPDIVRYLRWIITYTAGLAEGEIAVYTGLRHWPAWPGVIWLLLPMLVAVAIWVSWKE